jgi:hypothetical protein
MITMIIIKFLNQITDDFIYVKTINNNNYFYNPKKKNKTKTSPFTYH